MHSVIETNGQQFFAIVGSAYLSEHHADETHSYLSASECREFSAVNFNEVLEALRAALSLR